MEGASLAGLLVLWFLFVLRGLRFMAMSLWLFWIGTGLLCYFYVFIIHLCFLGGFLLLRVCTLFPYSHKFSFSN